MSTQAIFLLVPLLLWTVTGPTQAEQATATLDPQRIEVITDSAHPVTGLEAIAAHLEVYIYDLDSPSRLEAQLSEGLPADPTAAARLARQRLDTLGRQPLATPFAQAYAGLLKALEYGIDRYPAVVFDGGASVVYGITDLDEALDYYRRWCPRRGVR
jgi:integrating conjugative element protein (TIGR03757 family)